MTVIVIHFWIWCRMMHPYLPHIGTFSAFLKMGKFEIKFSFMTAFSKIWTAILPVCVKEYKLNDLYALDRFPHSPPPTKPCLVWPKPWVCNLLLAKCFMPHVTLLQQAGWKTLSISCLMLDFILFLLFDCNVLISIMHFVYANKNNKSFKSNQRLGCSLSVPDVHPLKLFIWANFQLKFGDLHPPNL